MKEIEMNKCALCQSNEANKKNTHYLSDNIIKLAFNIEGSSEREKGFYYTTSNVMPTLEFNFQRNVTGTELMDRLHRETTEEENAKARNIPSSADYKFCSDCEVKFTKIEQEFNERILPKFRDNQTKINKEEIFLQQEATVIRRYFYLQIWRTHICDGNFILPEENATYLRDYILNESEINYKPLPLSIAFLETLSKEDYTENLVGIFSGKNPYVIFMNDFIIQMFDIDYNIITCDLFGLNSGNFNDYVNKEESQFKVKIIDNKSRKTFLSKYNEFQGQCFLAHICKIFRAEYFKKFNREAQNKAIASFLDYFINDGNFRPDFYSESRIRSEISNYLKSPKKN